MAASTMGNPASLGFLDNARVLLVKATTEITPHISPNSNVEVSLALARMKLRE